MIKSFFIISLLLFIALSCSEKRDTLEVGAHPEGWNNPASEKFHGKTVIESGRQSCQSCHGENYEGGNSGVSCYTCHVITYPHPNGFAQIGSPQFHGQYFKDIANWELQPCQTCHGTNYTGGNTGTSCKNSGCHSSAKGPEACNTCHGQFTGNVASLKTWAPPKGLNDETDMEEVAVGAHQAHLDYYSYLPDLASCQECHIVPQNYSDPGHIDDSPDAEVVFDGSLAYVKTEGGNRVPSPTYSNTNNTCSSVYCHGNWGLLKAQSSRKFAYGSAVLMEGNSANVNWTNTTAAVCGSCHNLPPTGHVSQSIDDCSDCHTGVVDEDGVILDNQKHINGKVNVFGEEYPMF